MSTEIVMPRLSDTMDRGTIAKWNKQPGDPVKRGDVLVEIETDKANMELESYADGILAQIMAKEGDTADVGAPIGIVAEDEKELSAIQSGTSARGDSSDSDGNREASSPPSPEPPSVEGNGAGGAARAAEPNGRVKASPLARRIAQQRGIDLRLITGTGPGGRIVREDVETFEPGSEKAEQVAEPSPSKAETRPERPAPVREPAAEDTEIELSRMQQAVGRRLSESAFTAPHFYVTAEIDMTHAARMRAQVNEAEPDLKVSYNDLIVKAVGTVLSRFPGINASYREGKVVRHADVNVGVAADLPDGLIVPVVKNVDRKGLRELSREIRELVQAARDGRLRQNQLEGGTFTVSNLGMFGVDQFTAIINPPESAILAVGAIQEKPVVVDHEIAVRLRMRVTLSSDHRVIYGAGAAQFLAELTRVLEHPVLALL